MQPPWIAQHEPLAGYAPERTADEPAMRVRQAAAAATAAVQDEELRKFVNGEAQLRALAVHADFYTDEDALFELLSLASSTVVELERLPPMDQHALDAAQRLLKAILGFCTAWMRMAACGRLEEGAERLRGRRAAELVFQTVSALLTSESGLGASMLLSFDELEGLTLMGKAACHVEEDAVVGAVRSFREVTRRFAASARQRERTGNMMRSLEGFRENFCRRLTDLAVRSERRMLVVRFKEVVNELGGILSEAYSKSQVVDILCGLSLQLTSELVVQCPGIPDADGIEALDWLTNVLRTLLERGSTDASPESIRDWLETTGFFARLASLGACRVQQRAAGLLLVLLQRRVLAPAELVSALAKAGALSPASSIPATCRLALQGAVAAAAANLPLHATLDLIDSLCGLWPFAALALEGVDLLVQLTRVALAVGYDANSTDAGSLNRSLAVMYLLRFLQWGHRQEDADRTEALAFALRSLRALLSHTGLRPLLPLMTAEALSLALENGGGAVQPAAAARCSRVLGRLAADISATVRGEGRIEASAWKLLLQTMPPVGAAVPFDGEHAEYWLAAFVDALSTFLAAKDVEIGSQEVGILWSRLVVRPILGLPVSFGALQYFKLAFAAPGPASVLLLAPYLAAPHPPTEVKMAYISIFCPSSFQDAPPLNSSFFFPEARRFREEGSVVAHSPPRLPPPLRRSFSSDDSFWPEIGADSSLNALAQAAATANVELPETSASVPRLRLDRVQAVLPNPQGTSLFGELTVYDATERRLWDEFDELGSVEDAEALRQRDAAALRCLAVLDKEIDAAGRAGRELPSALAEARAKFSSLCELAGQGASAAMAQRIGAAELAFASAEEEFIEASSAHRRLRARCRRQGEPSPSTQALTAARSNLDQAHLALVAEMRLAAQWAQLGLVEITGIAGFARALRAAGPTHADPLLERLLHHSRWCAKQAENDRRAASAPSSPIRLVKERPSAVAMDSMDAETLLKRAELRVDAFAGFDATPLGNGIRAVVARKQSAPAEAVVLKAYQEAERDLCLRELQALRKLRGHPQVLSLMDVFKSAACTYLQLPYCPGGTLEQWCAKHEDALQRGRDADVFVRGQSIWRQIWQAVGQLHVAGVCHGDLTLQNVLLWADLRPVLADFRRCALQAPVAEDWWPAPTADYAAPELEADPLKVPTLPADVYSAGVAMAKTFLGLEIQVSSCPYHPTRGHRSLPEERSDADVCELLQLLLAEKASTRPSASSAQSHRGLEPLGFLRRRGLLGSVDSGPQTFLSSAELLREEFRGKRVEEPLMLSRETVFDDIAGSKVGEWREEALLGEWRVMLSDESGVDGGGLRREVVTLFFEQLESSSLVLKAGMDGSEVLTLFVNDRQRAQQSVQQWRQTWTTVGAMLLRALVHFGNAPLALSSAIFDCALGRLPRLPPDDLGAGVEEDVRKSIDRMIARRDAEGDDWALSQLSDLLRRLRRADPQKEAGYRWMLAQRVQESADGRSVVSALSTESFETVEAMLEPAAYGLLARMASPSSEGKLLLDGAAFEWVLLWDLYLKYLGGGDRWLAYQALAAGFTTQGRRSAMWSSMTGEQIVELLEGVPLTPEAVLPNLEFKPGYGYETQIQYFTAVLASFSAEELQKFLRFATGIGRLPASRRFPAGQKLAIRFMPTDNLDQLPSAHTCFWVVDVPPYEDQEDMGRKLRVAIAAPQPFALS